MLFNSLEFLIFFPIVTIGYFLLPHKYRWFWLLLASCYFYMVFKPIYILILGFTIVIDYYAGIYLERTQGQNRRWLLLASIIANVGVLAIFKYYNFLNENLTTFLGIFQHPNPVPYLDILLPVGLSFHTFQAMSYTIEVYRGNQKAEQNFGIYALYVMFYPQLVAGPIERPQNVLHQFYEKHTFDYKNVTDGLKLMAWGLFKKVVIADRLVQGVNFVYDRPQEHQGLPLIISTIFFAFQIYCDFSGYSDIALGSAQVMGFKLMKNFDRPYFSKSISEFWKRWHISLSTWFRDYLYISLGGNRVSVSRWYFNLFITFMVSGIWHGANWTFIIWGALHGTYLVMAIVTQDIRTKVNQAIGILRSPSLLKITQIITTFILADIAWVFFRAKNLSDALYIISHFFTGWQENIQDLLNKNFEKTLFLGMSKPEFAYSLFFIAFLLGVEYFHRGKHFRNYLAEKPQWLRWTLYYGIVLCIIFFGSFKKVEFIYFQF